MEQTELIEKVRKLGELIGTLSGVVYTQSCFIQILGQPNAKLVDYEGLVNASEIQRCTLRMAMKSLGIVDVDSDLDELDTMMEQFKKYQKILAEDQKLFKERRAAINRGETPRE